MHYVGKEEVLRDIVDRGAEILKPIVLKEHEKEFVITESHIRQIIADLEEHPSEASEKIIDSFGKCPRLEDYCVMETEVQQTNEGK